MTCTHSKKFQIEMKEHFRICYFVRLYLELVCEEATVTRPRHPLCQRLGLRVCTNNFSQVSNIPCKRNCSSESVNVYVPNPHFLFCFVIFQRRSSYHYHHYTVHKCINLSCQYCILLYIYMLILMLMVIWKLVSCQV